MSFRVVLFTVFAAVGRVVWSETSGREGNFCPFVRERWLTARLVLFTFRVSE